MRRISKKKLSAISLYKEKKKELFLEDLKKGNLRCFLSDKRITISQEEKHLNDDTLIGLLECHHLNQERENERLYDENMMVPVLRYYHRLYHTLSVNELITYPWYKSFLVRLKIKSKEVYRKELGKQLKVGLITIEEYERNFQ